MQEKFPRYTPVKHKSGEYSGWIHATTKIEELFTGNKETQWQYTISIAGSDKRKVAPTEDIEWISEKAEFPAPIQLENNPEEHYQKESRLHAIGYNISDLESTERHAILKYVAVPILGVSEVVGTILALMHARLRTKKERAEKYRYAFLEWNKDIDMLCENYKDDPDFKDPELTSFLKKVKDRLKTLDIE